MAHCDASSVPFAHITVSIKRSALTPPSARTSRFELRAAELADSGMAQYGRLRRARVCRLQLLPDGSATEEP